MIQGGPHRTDLIGQIKISFSSSSLSFIPLILYEKNSLAGYAQRVFPKNARGSLYPYTAFLLALSGKASRNGIGGRGITYFLNDETGKRKLAL